MGRLIKLKSNTIDAAAGEILDILEGMRKHERNIYFMGWCGLGASAALRVAAQHLKSQAAKGRKFGKVVHVDCSLWQSMRALQKAVAVELELPQSVMAIFDQHDEEDDFNGIEQGSRGVIFDVREEIFRKLVNNTFVVIFHNGSNHYIDLYECGVPAIAVLSNKVLLTWSGRFRLYLKVENMEKANLEVDAVMVAAQLQDDVLHEEALEVARCMGILEPEKIVECFHYVWAQRHAGCIDWRMHASNYWVCDGIIQGQGDTSAWEVGDGLHRNINLDWIKEDVDFEEAINACISGLDDRWVSTTHQALIHDDFGVLPPRITSFFLLPEKSKGRRVVLPVVMFPNNNRLRVLHLSWCTFRFTSPPFLCCSHLRFLLLDHCTDVRDEEHESNNQNGSCFQKLWVLDLRYTDWYSKKIMSLMDELRELNVEGIKDWRIVDLCGSKASLVKLRVAADPDSVTERAMQRPIVNMSRASHLKTVILENCVGLEQVVSDVLPPFLESFSFIITDAAIPKISSISFRGLAKMKSVLLRGVMENLQELDLSGTAVKTVDLRKVVALNLKRLILLGCEKLRAIQLPPPRDAERLRLEVLHIDTIRSASSAQANWEEKTKETIAASRPCRSSRIAAVTARRLRSSSCIAAVPARRLRRSSFDWEISVRDARLLRSLVPFKEFFYSRGGCMEMASSSASSVVVGDCECVQGTRQHGHYLYARDVIFQDHLQAFAANEGAIKWMSTPRTLIVDVFKGWYVHIQDGEEMKSGLWQQQGSSSRIGSALIVPDICDYARILHVHDSLSITNILALRYSTWTRLEQCQVERCPKLSSAFSILIKKDDSDDDDDDGRVVTCFPWLTTFRASQLLKARYIWNWSTTCIPSKDSFQCLKFLHLDYCPRLIYVLPLSVHMTTLPNLVTLEIVCCGNLMGIFPLDPKRQEKETIINFPELKHIHLHDLPKLQRICGSKIIAPKLETIKTRGCWSLRRLPAVAKQCPEVECEKEWWDSLEWDEGDVNHHPSLYKPSHSKYYKKTQLPRGTILR